MRVTGVLGEECLDLLPMLMSGNVNMSARAARVLLLLKKGRAFLRRWKHRFWGRGDVALEAR